jgi:hypothetical protein
MLPDLVPAVLSFLHDDTPTILSCALVHRSWTTAAQAILFDTVKIRPRRIGSSIYEPSYRPCLVIDALTQSPHLRPLVHALYIYDHYDPRYLDPATPRLLFPNVSRIHVAEDFDAPDAFLNNVPSLKSLECSYWTGEERDLPDLQLTHLTIHFLRPAGTRKDWLSGTSVARTLRNLVFRVAYDRPKTSDFYEIVLRLPCLEELRIYFALREYTPPSTDAYGCNEIYQNITSTIFAPASTASP